MVSFQDDGDKCKLENAKCKLTKYNTENICRKLFSRTESNFKELNQHPKSAKRLHSALVQFHRKTGKALPGLGLHFESEERDEKVKKDV